MAVDTRSLDGVLVNVARRTDDWPTDNENESSIDYNFMTRHPAMSYLFITLTVVCIIAGTIGNIMVIGAVLSYKRLLRNTGNYFIVNLAIADLCITCIVSPSNIMGVVHGPSFYLDKVPMCNIIGGICTVSCMCSMMSIATVAVNRLVSICRHFWYHTVYNRRRTACYCIGLWIYCVGLDLPNFVGWGGHTFGLKEMGCTFDRTANYSYTIFLATVGIIIPMIVVLVSYSLVWLYVQHSRNTLQRLTQRHDSISRGGLVKNTKVRNSSLRVEDLQLAFTLFITFLVFIFCWSPYMLAILADFEDNWPKEVYVMATLLGHSNSCLNCIIYALSNKRFREGYMLFLQKTKIIAKRNDSVYYVRNKSSC